MTDLLLSPSKARIERADLFRHDGSSIGSILGIITELNLTQSIDASAFSGSLKVVDNVGLFESVPLRGEERLELTVVANDLETRRELSVRVYRIDNVVLNDANDGASYYMHFISSISFEASKKTVTRSFSGGNSEPVSAVAETIFNDYFSSLSFNRISELLSGVVRLPITNTARGFTIQPTDGRGDLIIPSYSPTEAMYFLTNRAFLVNSGFSSCSFRFFETLEDFYFVSEEWLIRYANDQDRVINLFYAPQISKNPVELQQQVNSIERIDYPQRVDSAMDMYSGGYSNRVIEVDFVRGQVKNIRNEATFNYLRDARFLDMNGDQRDARTYIHTEQFANDTFTDENARKFLLFRDYSSDGDNPGIISRDQHLADITSRRISYRHHLNNTSINASLKGRLDIYPGSIVNLEVTALDASSDRGKNPQLSGNYLVYSTNHNIQYEELRTNLRLVKYDWST